jgi:hypothetical protein
MKLMSRISFLIFAIICCTLHAQEKEHMDISNEGASLIKNISEERIYFSLDQLWLEAEGMYVDLQEKVLPIEALYRDNKGYYTLIKNRGERWQCEKGHPAPNGDGRCNQPDCPYARRPDWGR